MHKAPSLFPSQGHAIPPCPDALQAQLSMLHRQLHLARQAAVAGDSEALRADEAESQCEHLRSDLAAATSQLQQQEDKMRALQQEARTLRGAWQARQPRQSCPGTWVLPLSYRHSYVECP